MSTPDLTTFWQRYTLDARQVPTIDDAADAPPGLYRNDQGQTWLKDGAGNVTQLVGAGSGPPGPQGDPGPEGPAGPAGPTNLFEVEVMSTGTPTEIPSGWTCAKLGTGQYRLNHTLGNYTTYMAVVSVNMRNATPEARIAQLHSRDNGFLVVDTFDLTGGFADTGWSMLLWQSG